MKELKGRLKNREEGKQICKFLNIQPQPQPEAEEVETTAKTKKKVISKDKSMKLLLLKNPILSGKTFQVLKTLKMP